MKNPKTKEASDFYNSQHKGGYTIAQTAALFGIGANVLLNFRSNYKIRKERGFKQ